jgi:hypothetical protein
MYGVAPVTLTDLIEKVARALNVSHDDARRIVLSTLKDRKPRDPSGKVRGLGDGQLLRILSTGARPRCETSQNASDGYGRRVA